VIFVKKPLFKYVRDVLSTTLSVADVVHETPYSVLLLSARSWTSQLRILLVILPRGKQACSEMHAHVLQKIPGVLILNSRKVEKPETGDAGFSGEGVKGGE
jgi:hypothetical protein